MARINLSAQDALSQQRLMAVLSYDTVSGRFTYKVSRLHGRCAVIEGGRAGKKNPKNSYRYINIDGHAYLEHRLAVFYVTGKWPNREVDHRNGVRDDNSWTNLREATRTENKQNMVSRLGMSGVRGVVRRGGRWIASIKVNGKYKYLGVYSSAVAAGQAYLNAKAKYHPFQPVPRDSGGLGGTPPE